MNNLIIKIIGLKDINWEKKQNKKRRARPVDAMIHLVGQTIDLFNLHFELVIAI